MNYGTSQPLCMHVRVVELHLSAQPQALRRHTNIKRSSRLRRLIASLRLRCSVDRAHTWRSCDVPPCPDPDSHSSHLAFCQSEQLQDWLWYLTTEPILSPLFCCMSIRSELHLRVRHIQYNPASSGEDLLELYKGDLTSTYRSASCQFAETSIAFVICFFKSVRGAERNTIWADRTGTNKHTWWQNDWRR